MPERKGERKDGKGEGAKEQLKEQGSAEETEWGTRNMGIRRLEWHDERGPFRRIKLKEARNFVTNVRWG